MILGQNSSVCSFFDVSDMDNSIAIIDLIMPDCLEKNTSNVNPISIDIFFPVCIGGGGTSQARTNLVNCSALRSLTEMRQYSMEKCCPDNSKKYRLISVGDL